MNTFKELLDHHLKASGKTYRQLGSVLGDAHTFIARAGKYDPPFKKDMLQQVIRSIGGIPRSDQIRLHHLAFLERMSDENRQYADYLTTNLKGFSIDPVQSSASRPLKNPE